MKRYPAESSSTAPSPRTASEMSRAGGPPGISSAARVVGWNWKNSRSRTAAPARQARARPSAVATAGLLVRAKSRPAPPVASRTASAASCLGPSAGQVGHAGDPGRRRGLLPRCDSSSGSASARSSGPVRSPVTNALVSTRSRPWPARSRTARSRTAATSPRAMQAPVASPPACRMRGAECAASRPRAGPPSGAGVEMHAVAAQAGDVPDGLGAQDPDCLGVVEPGTGGERVRDVRCHGVTGGGILRGQHGRDAALGVEGVALLQRPLAQEDHLDVTAAGGGVVGGEQRGVEPRNPAADDHEPPGHGRAASMRSRATLAGAATSSSTVMRLSTSPRTSASRTQAR